MRASSFLPVTPGVSAPIYYKENTPYCPISLCYKYVEAPLCPRSSTSATHKCKHVPKSRKVWKCKFGEIPTTTYLPSGESAYVCQCEAEKKYSKVLTPQREVRAKC